MPNLAFAGLALLLASAAAAQDAPPPTMQMTITSVPLAGADGLIYVNQDCGLLPDLSQHIDPKAKIRSQADPDLCHIEGQASSEHDEQQLAGTQMVRVRVEIREQEFVLHNVTLKPVVFYVLVHLLKGWVVDSDPPPIQMVDDVAVFEAHAGEGETVHLHVGIRHTKDRKPLAIPRSSAPQPSPPGP
jgi:hypothetical protein